MQNGLTSGTADKLKHGQVLTFLTFHNVKQVLADGGCAGLGFGLRLGLRSIFVFVLVVVVVLLGWASEAMPAHVAWLVFLCVSKNN